jgi:hypothetical protein
MAKGEEKVVVTKDKEVAKGVEVDRKSHAGGEIVAAVLTAGLSELGGRKADDVSVATEDGRKVTGEEVKFDDNK